MNVVETRLGIDWIEQVLAIGLIFWVVLVPSAAATAFLERKLGADVQARVGPNQAGSYGILQIFADLLKLLQKQDSPRKLIASRFRVEGWGSVVIFSVLFSSIPALPFGSNLLLVESDLSAIIPFLVSIALGVVMLTVGLLDRSVESYLSSLRVLSQVLAASFPAAICLLCAGVVVDSFSWRSIVAAQGFAPLSWNLFSFPPFMILCGPVYFVSGLMLLQIAPLDSSLSSPELRGGIFFRAVGRKIEQVALLRYYALFLWSMTTVALFLGGWNLPSGWIESLRDSDTIGLLQFLEFGTMMVKSHLLILFVILISKVIPRIRVDQATDFSWGVLSPIALLSLMGCTLWRLYDLI